MKKLTKQYQLWTNSEGYYYSLSEYDSLEEALTAEKYTHDWYITKKVDIKITENE